MKPNNLDLLPEEMVEPKVGNNKMKTILNWFVRSSVDSSRLSLTIKALIPFLVLTGISDTDTLNSLVGSIGDLVVKVGELATGAVAVFGLLRKIWLSLDKKGY